VAIITVPMLGAHWYRDNLRRHALLPDQAVDVWPGLGALLHSTSMRAAVTRRPVRVSVLLDARDRVLIEPAAAWVLEGLVYAPSFSLPPRTLGLDLVRMGQASERIPPSALDVLPLGADPAAEQMQALLRCPQVRTLRDSLLVGTCNGS
jgi:hypothetical protein